MLYCPCTETHRHGQDAVLVIYKPYNCPRESSTTRQLRAPSYHATWSSQSLGEISYKDATQHGNATLFRFWQHHGVTRRVAGVFFRDLCSLGEIAQNHVWNLPAISQMRLLGLGLAFRAPSALRHGAS